MNGFAPAASNGERLRRGEDGAVEVGRDDRHEVRLAIFTPIATAADPTTRRLGRSALHWTLHLDRVTMPAS